MTHFGGVPSDGADMERSAWLHVTGTPRLYLHNVPIVNTEIAHGQTCVYDDYWFSLPSLTDSTYYIHGGEWGACITWRQQWWLPVLCQSQGYERPEQLLPWCWHCSGPEDTAPAQGLTMTTSKNIFTFWSHLKCSPLFFKNKLSCNAHLVLSGKW